MKQPLATIRIILLALLSLLLIGCTAPATPAPAAAAPAAAEAEPTATAVPAQAESSGSWEVVLQAKVRQPVRMAAFLNETFGVTGGATGAGKAHQTTDGGQTWTLAESSGGCLYGVEIVDEQVVWVCGRMRGQSFGTPGGVRMSLNGGQTWEPQANYQSEPGFCPLSFLDTKIGWVANAGRLSATADGGATWEEITLPEGIAEIVAISLRTPSEGYVLDDAGDLYVTLDGGKSWSTRTLGLDEYGELKLLPISETTTAAMRFPDADHGIVVLNLAGGGDNRVVALRTADGGQTWEEESVPAKLGIPYLARDGALLTLAELIDTSNITVLRYGEN